MFAATFCLLCLISCASKGQNTLSVFERDKHEDVLRDLETIFHTVPYERKLQEFQKRICIHGVLFGVYLQVLALFLAF